MTPSPPRPRRRLPVGVVRAGAAVAIVLAAAACSGGGDNAGGEPVPTLLTAPIASTSTSSSSTTSTSSTIASAGSTSSSTTPTTTPVTSSTSASSTSGDAGAPSGPGASTTVTSATTASTAASSSTVASASSTAAATSTTADIEPAAPTLAPTVPIPTASQPPDTTGGIDADYLLAPKAIAGLQFGASRTTVLDRLRGLLGDPLRVTELAKCAGGPAVALQWFNASVIVTDRGLVYYTVGMNIDEYFDEPVPGWHTAAGLTVGADRAQLDALYPGQVTYGAPSGLFTPFTVTAGADTGLAGRLEGDFLQTVSAGSSTC